MNHGNIDTITNIVPLHEKNLTAFSFEGTRIKESCWIAGKPHFTARAIGEWLEYPYALRSIRNIVLRNPHIREFATVIKLMIVAGGREVTRELEVYDPIGLQLIINKSSQPKALLFQIAVAHLVLAYMAGEIVPSKWSQKGEFLSAARQIMSMPEGTKRRALIVDLSRRENILPTHTYRKIEELTGERLKTTKGKPRRIRSDAGIYKNGAEYKHAMAYRADHQRAKGKEIKQALGLTISASRINVWIRSDTVRGANAITHKGTPKKGPASRRDA